MTGIVIGVGQSFINAPGRLDALAAIISGELAEHRLEVQQCLAVESGVLRLRSAVAKALEQADMVFVLGGMGASAQDVTKEAVCQVLGRRLVPHEETKDRLQRAYKRSGRAMPEAVESITMFPEQSVVFPGVRGLIPGCAIAAGKQFLMLLPEGEKELLPMVQKSVAPYLDRFFSSSVDERIINVFGLTKEQAIQRLGERLEHMSNPSLRIRERDGVLELVVSTKASSKAESLGLSTGFIRQITADLEGYVYGVDQVSLPHVLGGALVFRNMRIALCEVRSGGRIAQWMGELPLETESPVAASQVIETLGEQAAFFDVTERQLRRDGVCTAMGAACGAVDALSRSGAQVGIAVICSGSIYENRQKNACSYCAVAWEDKVWVQPVHHASDVASREDAVTRTCLSAVNLARMVVEAMPQSLSGANDWSTVKNNEKKLQLMPGLFNDAGSGGKKSRRKKQKKKTAEKPLPQKRGILSYIFPWRGDTPSQACLKVVLLLAFFTLTGSGGYLGSYYFQAYSNRELQKTIADMYDADWMLEDNGESAGISSDLPAGYQPKFSSLYRVNNDVVGWIKIEDTQINYPVVQYIDNVFYMRRDFYMQTNRHGVPWLEAAASVEPQSDNYIIYGHNMADGQMFGQLNDYKPDGQGLSFLESHSLISMDDVYRDNDYVIFAVFICAAEPQYGEVFYYNYYSDLSEPEDFASFVTEVRSRSFYDADIDVEYGDKFLTLSTCSYEYGPTSDDSHVRTVVVARRIRDGESIQPGDVRYTVNTDPRMPPGFTDHGGTGAGSASQQVQEDIAVMAAAIRRERSAEEKVQLLEQEELSRIIDEQLKREVVNQIEKFPLSSAESRDPSLLKRANSSFSDTISTENALVDDAAVFDEDQGQADEDSSVKDDPNSSAAHSAAYSDGMENADSDTVETTTEDNGDGAVTEMEQDDSAFTPDEAEASTQDDASSAASEAEESPTFSETAPAAGEVARRGVSIGVWEDRSHAHQVRGQDRPPEAETAEQESITVEVNADEVPESSEEAAGINGSAQAEAVVQPTDAADSASASSPPPDTSAESGSVQLTITANGQRITRAASEIIPMVVANEMGGSFQVEALKAQAVAAYTFIRYENQAGRAPSLGVKTPNSTIKAACDEVLGQAIYYQGALAFTPFFSTSAGATIGSADVWGGHYPYLVSVSSPACQNADNFAVRVNRSAEQVASRVKQVMGIDLYTYGDPSTWLNIVDYIGNTRYVKTISVGGKTTSGRAFRESVMGLRSAAFAVSYDSGSGVFSFITNGYGHGVGMSQMGAHFYSAQGWNYAQILEHYYTGAVVA